MSEKITISGIGSIIIDRAAGTLRPSTHVVGQRIGVGYSFDDARKMEAARERVHEIQRRAGKSDQDGGVWEWVDHNGCTVSVY